MRLPRFRLFAPARKPARPLPCRPVPYRRLALEPLEERTLLSLTPTLVADVNPFTSSLDRFYSPSVTVGNINYFMANDGIHGLELWKSDGTEAGTVLVKDLLPGPASSLRGELVAAGQTVYFTSRSVLDWTDTLWKTDGTEAGTAQVPLPGEVFSVFPLTVAGDKLLFTLTGPGEVSGLWTLDLDSGAWRRIHEVTPFSDPVVINDKVFFSAWTGTTGDELWVSDGTEAGTFLLKGMAPGSSGVWEMHAVGAALFFTFDDGVHGEELWISDGTRGGTRMVKDIRPGAAASFPYSFANLGGQLFFSADDGVFGQELWRSDGTEEGTVLVKNIVPGSGSSYPFELAAIGDRIFFSASGGQHGREVFISDGTEAGTRLLKDINPGWVSSNVRDFTEVGGQAFFSAQDVDNGWALWKSDGTEAGTQLVKDAVPGFYGVRPIDLRNVGGLLFFNWHDGVRGQELWKSDGTSAGTIVIKDINTSSSDDSHNAHDGGGRYFAEAGGKVFFRADDWLQGTELWSTDGQGRPYLVEDIEFGPASSRPNGMVSFKSEVFFGVFPGFGSPGLWKSDGTAEGTSLVRNGIVPQRLHVWGDVLLFRFETGLWATDGTARGTRQIKELTNFNTGSRPSPFVASNGLLFFDSGPELWRTDGTEAGTVRIAAFAAGTQFRAGLVDVAGTLYFALEGAEGDELWKSDGTPHGTVRVKIFPPAGLSQSPTAFAAFNGVLYFSAGSTNSAHGRELWRSDGTEAGTYMVADLRPGGLSAFPGNLTVVDDHLFFSAFHSSSAMSLWKTDGTEAGTVMVRSMPDEPVRPGGGDIRELTAINGLLVFCADDGTHGRELWVSNGTESGTFMVADIRPGELGSVCVGLTKIGDRLYFDANDGRTGLEPWKLDVPKARSLMVTGADAGAGPHVRAIDAVSGAEQLSFFAYDPSFSGGVRVATGDVNGDAIPDIITAAGPGGGPHVRVFNGFDGQPLAGPLGSFFAYQPEFSGGVHVAAADFNGDGFDDIVTAADAGGGPHVRVFSGQDGSELASFFAYDPGFSGGVRLATADVDRDGRPDIITAPGPGGGPHIRVFNGRGVQLGGPLGSFFAYAPEFGGGVFVAAGDLNGDGRPEIVTGAGAGGPHVRVFNGATGTEAASFYAFAPEFGGGVRVAVGDADGDGDRDLITATGPGGGPHVRAFDGRNQRELASFFAYQSEFAGGVFTAGSGLYSDALASHTAPAVATASHAGAAAVQQSGTASTGQPAGLSAEWLAAAAGMLQAPQSGQAGALVVLPPTESRGAFDLAALLAADPSVLLDEGAELLEHLRRSGVPSAALEELLADESRWADVVSELSPALASELSDPLLAGA